MSSFNGVMVDRGPITGVINTTVDVNAAVVTLTYRDEEQEASMRINVGSKFFETPKGDRASYATVKNNCIALAEMNGFDKYEMS